MPLQQIVATISYKHKHVSVRSADITSPCNLFLNRVAMSSVNELCSHRSGFILSGTFAMASRSISQIHDRIHLVIAKNKDDAILFTR